MRQVRTVLSTYSSDTFGVCSALYELGGMTVMHDASGCNSTYTTHDEPRWYHSDSLVFISGLTELDAVMGNDDRLIQDMLESIETLHPAFAAIAGTPIPMMNGCDLAAVANEVERASGIPCFAFPTSGMQSYLCGASDAFAVLAKRMTLSSECRKPNTVNILGATPLDFSLSPTVASIRRLLTESGFSVNGCWAMGSSFEQLRHAGAAAVNLVISGTGMKAAQVLKHKFGTPYVVGTPVGAEFSAQIVQQLRASASDGMDRIAFENAVPSSACGIRIVGESVISRSIAAAVGLQTGNVPQVVSTLEALPELAGICAAGDVQAMEEDEIQAVCCDAAIVIADPLYRPILPSDCRLLRMPHEAFSGRIYRGEMPDLTKFDYEEAIL